MRDDRFGALFKDEDFEIDEKSEHYKLLHPNAAKVDARKKRELIEEHFDTFDTSSDEEENVKEKNRKEKDSKQKKTKKKDSKRRGIEVEEGDTSDEEDADDDEDLSKRWGCAS